MENTEKKIKQQCWHVNGMYHRDGNKPAIIKYDTKGNVTSEEYYKYGIKVTKKFCEKDHSKMSNSKIFAEKNVQKRMMLLQLKGIHNVIKELTPISTYKLGQNKEIFFDEYELFDLKIDGESYTPYLLMRNASTGVVHIEGIDPAYKTAEEAFHEFRYGGKLREYNIEGLA